MWTQPTATEMRFGFEWKSRKDKTSENYKK